MANQCFACGQDSQRTPLVSLEYRGQQVWICPHDLPALIHDPRRLADRLPGADQMTPAPKHSHP
jgi:hypothetical protein